eukprot:12905315-Alexandrium_andersonii.AAC.1
MLPSTLRRLAETAAVGVLGPALEPTMSVWQAARRGGSCRRNICAATAHLGGRRPQIVAEGPRDGLPCPGL